MENISSRVILCLMLEMLLQQQLKQYVAFTQNNTDQIAAKDCEFY